jgi:hypothetical protein
MHHSQYYSLSQGLGAMLHDNHYKICKVRTGRPIVDVHILMSTCNFNFDILTFEMLEDFDKERGADLVQVFSSVGR